MRSLTTRRTSTFNSLVLGLWGTISPAMLAIFASLNKRTNLKVPFLNPNQMGALFHLSSNHIKAATPLNITMCSELKIHALTGNEISRAIPIRSSAVSKIWGNFISPLIIYSISSLVRLALATTAHESPGKRGEWIGRKKKWHAFKK